MDLDYDTVKNVGLAVVIGLVVLAVVVALVVKKIVGKIITVLLGALLVSFVWQQRASVIDAATGRADTARADYCALHPTFFAVRVDLPGCPSH